MTQLRSLCARLLGVNMWSALYIVVEMEHLQVDLEESATDFGGFVRY